MDKNAKKWFDIEKPEPNKTELNDPNWTEKFTLYFSTCEFLILTLTSDLVGLLNLHIIRKGTLNMY